MSAASSACGCFAEPFGWFTSCATGDLRESAREYERVKAVVAQNVELTPSANWLIRFFCACACAQHLASSDIRMALTYARRAHEVVAATGADFFVLRSHLMQSLVLDAANRRRDAVEAPVARIEDGLDLRNRPALPVPGRRKGCCAPPAATRHLYDEDVLMANFNLRCSGQKRQWGTIAQRM